MIYVLYFTTISLCVCAAGIHDLGCIGECTSLERLDLSGNNITNLAPLASLRILVALNVSANRISNLGKNEFMLKGAVCSIYCHLAKGTGRNRK